MSLLTLCGEDHGYVYWPAQIASEADVSLLIAAEVGGTGVMVWDTTEPNGQPRRCLDVSRAKQLFGFRATHSSREGTAKTVAWFLAHRTELRDSTLKPLMTRPRGTNASASADR